jgi:uncharacterized protein (TIGR00255 family)
MKTQSMTGFGEGSASVDSVEVSIELKSVNHRFLDVVVRAPSTYNRFEASIVKRIREKLRRGRVEVFISRNENSSPEFEVVINESLLREYSDKITKSLKQSGVNRREAIDLAVVNFLSKREVSELRAKESQSDDEAILFSALDAGIESLVEMRTREGKQLESEVLSILGELVIAKDKIKALADGAPAALHSRISERLEKLLEDRSLDEQRLCQEVAILADKADVTEELVRLDSHFSQFRHIIKEGGGGRKLEFLLQEFGREINTIGSKSQESDITKLVVDAKAHVEKLREQVANIE